MSQEAWLRLAPPIKTTLILPFCWVCNAQRKDIDASVAPMEEHHIVPRSYGGADGPTVTICPACHTNAHTCGEALFKGNSTLVYKFYSDQIKQDRCLYLAEVICRSKALASKSENKRYVYSGFLKAETHKKLRDLVTFYGKKASQQKIIVLAIEELHKKHFGKKE